VKKFVALVVTPALIATGLIGGASLAGAQGADDQRVKPRSVTFKVTPKKDTKKPWKYKIRGRVGVPKQLPPKAQGCPPGVAPGNPYCKPQREKACKTGKVAIRFKTGKGKKLKNKKVTISLRRAKLKPGPASANPWFCTFSKTVKFRDKKRFRGDGRLKVNVRFLGNEIMKAKSAKPKSVRTKKTK